MATKNTKIEIKKSNDILFPYTGEIYEGSDIVVAPGNCAIYLCDGDYEVFPAGTDVLGVKKKRNCSAVMPTRLLTESCLVSIWRWFRKSNSVLAILMS